ncbi:catalase family peroxidase [Mycobacterium sp. MAA66]|uniref:catalase family peroxidase n=1 Tax=Mycobacterium sp. MAA66 TaxID=3156297 RepID=UPI003513F8C1
MNDSGRNWRGTTLTRRSILVGLGAVGAFLAADLGLIAYASRGGDLTRQRFLDGFENVFGVHLGFRKNHAKGVAVVGYFKSNGNGAALSRAAVFEPGETPVMGRFSLAGGNPAVADTPGAARGLGLVFGLPGADQWRTAMLNLPVFPDNSPQGFYDRLLASKVDEATGKPDPKTMADFLTHHPETAAAMALVKKSPPTTGFADSTYSSLNTFYLAGPDGTRTPVRWSLIPHQSAVAAKSGDPNGLFDALIRQLKAAPLHWVLRLVLGEPGDPIDPTLPWPADRRAVDAGVLTLTEAQTERAGNARDVNFDPLVLPDGIEPSDDPLLSARSAVYAGSFRARTTEPKSASPVQVESVNP